MENKANSLSPAQSGFYITRTLKKLWPFIWSNSPRQRFILILSAVLLGLAEFAAAAAPLLFAQLIDSLNIAPALEQAPALLIAPALLAISYGVVNALNGLLGEVRYMLFDPTQQRALQAIRLEVFAHLHKLSLRFHLERRTGALLQIIYRGLGATNNVFNMLLWQFIPAILSTTFILYIVGREVGGKYIALIAIMVTIFIISTGFFTEWRLRLRKQMNASNELVQNHYNESLANFETVKYFNGEQHELRQQRTITDELHKIEIKTTNMIGSMRICQNGIIALSVTIGMYWGVRDVQAGTMSVGVLVLINTYMMQLYNAFYYFGSIYRDLRVSFVDMEKLLDLMAIDMEVKDSIDAKPLAVTQGSIVFDNVTFAYDERRTVLKNVSFTIEPKQTVAVVGPTGSGKSTLARLLFRFYDIQGGRILIDGQDISLVTQDSLRQHISIVPQDTVLFNESLSFNIAYGKSEASQDEIIRVAEQAQVHQFCQSLPDGYDTVVGERGLKLSGGEKQRVAIARTLLKDSPILILDEATSALDNATERDIQTALLEAEKGRTSLVIAHRLSTIKDADQILVMEAGQIVQRGVHDDLVSQPGLYRQLWEKQQKSSTNLVLEPTLDTLP